MLDLAWKYIPHVEDPIFLENLQNRKELKTKMDLSYFQGKSDFHYKWRHGLTPPTKNAQNIRYKKQCTLSEKDLDHRKIEEIQKILNDIINYGFSASVEEELLTFDKEGKLVDIQSGAMKEGNQDGNQEDGGFAYSYRDPSAYDDDEDESEVSRSVA